MKKILKTALTQSIDYTSYRELLSRLMALGKTTGNNHSEDMLHYTKMNIHRMRRLDKTFDLNDALKSAVSNLERKYIWLVITEGWCGDAAQIIPIMNRLSESSKYIDLQLVLRDENPELMDQYLTEGSRSIPKLIIIDEETGEEAGTWGPRPMDAQKMVMNYKANPNRPSYFEFSKDLQLWYTKDRAKQVQEELLEVMNKMVSMQPQLT